jgi:hypothetical protein
MTNAVEVVVTTKRRRGDWFQWGMLGVAAVLLVAGVGTVVAAGARLDSVELYTTADRWLLTHRPSWRAAQDRATASGNLDDTPLLECFRPSPAWNGTRICIGYDGEGIATLSCSATPFEVVCEPVARASQRRAP